MGVAEVREHVDGGDEGAAGDAGAAQRPEHVPKHLPAGGAHVVGRVFQIGGDGADDAVDHRVGIGKEGDGLHDPKPQAAVDVHLQPQQALGDDALDAEEQDVAQGHDKGRRDDGQQRHEAEQSLAGHVQPGDDVGEEERHRRTGDGGDQGHEEAVFDGREPARLVEQLQIVLCAGKENDPQHRIYHKKSHKQDDRDNGQQEQRLVFQPLHLLEGFPGGNSGSHGESLLSGLKRGSGKRPPALAQAGAGKGLQGGRSGRQRLSPGPAAGAGRRGDCR
jgi:hypothetical protein